MVEDPKPGDVVFLMSGSPPLTVRDVASDDSKKVLVNWFSGSQEKVAEFPFACLTSEVRNSLV